MCWCVLIDAISINEYSIRPSVYIIRNLDYLMRLLISNKSTISLYSREVSASNGIVIVTTFS